MTLPLISLKLAGVSDIPVIYRLAEEIWYDHYPAIISHEQIRYMLSRVYDPKSLEEQMKEGQMFYLVLNDAADPIGYLALTPKGEGKWFMNKFYIKTPRQASGIGSRVLSMWEEMAGPKEVSLQVNRKNYKSVNFYFKNGFKISRVADFDIGEGYSMDDFIMVKTYS